MNVDLVVVEPFGEYKVGDRITDAKAIEKALAENPSSVVKVAKPEKAPASN